MRRFLRFDGVGSLGVLTLIQFGMVIMTLAAFSWPGGAEGRLPGVIYSAVITGGLVIGFRQRLVARGFEPTLSYLACVPLFGPIALALFDREVPKQPGFDVITPENNMTEKNDPLVQIIQQLDDLAKHRDDAWQVPREEGEILRQIALAHNAKTIVEVGTSYGFSGLFFASALRITGGKLHTIDRDPKKYNSSRETFARAGVSDLVNNYLGDAHTVLLTMPSPIDVAFIDADKPNCQAYFNALWPKIAPGGCIITDNIATHREELAGYVKYLRSQPDAISAEINVGNGIEWTIKKR
jgi:predicted O-methyltransferase YrrM